MSTGETVMETGPRVARLREAMAGHDPVLPALWVTKPVNVRWLTGFSGSNGQLLVTAETVTLVTDARYSEQAPQEFAAHNADVVLEVTATDVGARLNGARGSAPSVGFESNHLTVKALDQAHEWFPDVTLVATDLLIDQLRQIKDSAEVARLASASGIADAALALVMAEIVPGVTERHVQMRLESAMAELGSERPSFESIVAAGANAAKPHARPSNTLLKEGDLLVLDFGATVDGYGSDMTRTVCVGGNPSAEQSEWYDAVAEAQAAGVATVVAGAEELSVDAACRSVLADRGIADLFTHGTGHGLGLEIHEQPILSTRSTGTLKAQQVVTVEPGVYRPGLGGVRVEDSVVVTDTGCTPITLFPKGLVPQ